MVADTKQVATLIKWLHDAAEAVKAASVNMEATRDLFLAENPDITGTPLENNLTAVNAWINDLTTLADSPIAAGMIAAHVPSHRGKAL